MSFSGKNDTIKTFKMLVILEEYLHNILLEKTNQQSRDKQVSKQKICVGTKEIASVGPIIFMMFLE